MIRAVLLLMILSLAVGGCGGEAEDGSGPGLEEECQARLVWDGVTYYSAGSPADPLALGKRLAEGHIPRCSGAPGSTLNILGIQGVDPVVAVAAEGEGGPLYAWLAPGYVLESPEHPLHDAIYGSPSEPNAEAGFRCKPPRSLQARALNTPAFDFTFLRVAAEDEESESFLRADDVDGIVSLDADTAIEGHERDGIPFVQAGDAFSLVLRECVGSKAEPGLAGLRRLVVERLGPLRRSAD